MSITRNVFMTSYAVYVRIFFTIDNMPFQAKNDLNAILMPCATLMLSSNRYPVMHLF